MNELLYKDEVYAIIGAAMEVYNEMGFGYLESIYQETLEIELSSRNIPYDSQKDLYIYYKGKQLKRFFTPDLLCYSKIVVDLKAIERLTTNDIAQMQNYLNGTKFELGLLINFGARSGLEYKRVILSRGRMQNQNRSLAE